jgi:hypothetical protein
MSTHSEQIRSGTRSGTSPTIERPHGSGTLQYAVDSMSTSGSLGAREPAVCQ